MNDELTTGQFQAIVEEEVRRPIPRTTNPPRADFMNSDEVRSLASEQKKALAKAGEILLLLPHDVKK